MHEEVKCVGPGVEASGTILEPAFKWVKRLGYKYEEGSICVLKDVPCDNVMPFSVGLSILFSKRTGFCWLSM